MKLPMVAFILLLGAPVLAGAQALSSPAPPPVVAPAQVAATAWLAEIDGGDYANAWSDADPLLKGAIDQTAFVQNMQGVRAPLGAVIQRGALDVRVTKTLPGAPDGSYQVLTFTTRFAHKDQATETLVMREEADGWKVSGYHVR